MGRPKGSKNAQTPELVDDSIDYPKLYEVLKKEDEATRELLAEANSKIEKLIKEKADLIKFYSVKDNTIEAMQNQYESLLSTVKTLKEKNRILLANYNNLRLKSSKSSKK